MQVVRHNAAFDQPREKLRAFFSRGDLFFSRDAHLCFVCGASGETLPESGARSLRSLFIEHAQTRADSKLVCVRAETAATELLRQLDERGQNISHFERTIAEAVDSILIFPESPGSFAELGYFSAYDSLAKKTLVAIREEHQGNSFINLGPVHAIAKISQFAPIPFVLAEANDDRMRQIAEKLLGESLRKRSYRERFEFKTWKDFDSQHQLSILDELIDVFGATTEVDLRHCVHFCFGAYDISTIRLQISILVATGRVARNDDGDIFAKERRTPFVDCVLDAKTELRLVWRVAFAEHDPDALRQLEQHRI